MSEPSSKPNSIEMPRATAAPVVLAFGIVLMGSGVPLSLAMSVVGAVVFVFGLALWIGHLLPGRGHHLEARVGEDELPKPIQATIGTVDRLSEGMPGFRMRLPLKVRPISAGIKGGLLGGVLMPIPALTWGILAGHGIWYPINLLAGMVWAGIGDLPVADLERFHLPFLLVGIVIHGMMSLILGLIYGVLLPTLPPIPGGQFVWGGLLMPLFWTGMSYGMMGVVNPDLQRVVDWPWFVASQFVFGVTAAIVVIRTEQIAVPPKGMGPDTESLTR